MSTTRIGVDYAYPFKLPWSLVPTGSYLLSATAFDKGGLSTTSTSLALTIGSSDLGSPWSDAFLGITGIPGEASESGGTYTLEVGGTDLIGAIDGGQFAFQAISGDGRITARITGVENTASTAKAGLMIRDTLSPGGKTAFVGLLPDGTVKVLKRTTLNGAMNNPKTGSLSIPYWLTLMRKAGVVAAYASSDGTNWSYQNHFTTSLATLSYFGLAATSSDSTEEQTSTFSNVSVASGSVNFPPQISMTGPLAGRTFNAGTLITLAATVSDLDGSSDITGVKFYSGATLLNTDILSPFTFTWTSTSGSANLKGRVEDLGGGSTYTDGLNITINASGVKTLFPDKDDYVRDGTYATANYGLLKTISIKSSGTLGQNYISYLVFPITSMSSISGATLRLYGNLDVAGSVTVGAYSISDTTWKESGTGSLNWNNKPAFGSLLGSATFSSTTPAWKEINVGSYLAARKSAGAAYVCLGIYSASATTPVVLVVSRNAVENAGRPELVLTP